MFLWLNGSKLLQCGGKTHTFDHLVDPFFTMKWTDEQLQKLNVMFVKHTEPLEANHQLDGDHSNPFGNSQLITSIITSERDLKTFLAVSVCPICLKNLLLFSYS